MYRLYVALILLIFSSCTPAHLTAEELTAYVADEKNGLKKSIALGDTQIEVTYRPTDLWIEQEIGGEKVDSKKIEEVRKKYNQYYYFILSLSHSRKEALHQASREQYSELVKTLSFRMSDYVSLTTAASDTIPVGDFMLNRTYGLSSSTDVLFVFNKEKAKDKIWVQFNLNEFGMGIGNQRFRFDTSHLEHSPTLEW